MTLTMKSSFGSLPERIAFVLETSVSPPERIVFVADRLVCLSESSEYHLIHFVIARLREEY